MPAASPELGATPVRVLAWLHVLLGGLGCLAAVALCASLWLSSDPRSGEALAFVLPPALLAVLALLLPQLFSGWGLLRQSAWAPGVAMAVSVVYLLLFPLGTVLGIYGLWALRQGGSARGTPAEAPMHSASAPVAVTPAATQRRALLLTMAAVGVVMFSALAVALKTLPATPLQLHPAAAQQDLRPLVGGAALLLGLLAAAVALARRWWGRRTLRFSLSAEATRLRARVAELRNDPDTRPYADRVARGERWSDEQIAYDLDPGLLATCIHLQPVERLMRQRGVPVRLRWANSVQAMCRIDAQRLEQDCPPLPPATYAEYYEFDRGAYGDPVAAVHCPACRSRIDTLHPEQVTPAGVRFPA